MLIQSIQLDCFSSVTVLHAKEAQTTNCKGGILGVA